MECFCSILYESDLSYAEISRRSGISRSHISRIASGVYLPKISTLYKILCSIQVDIKEFFKNYKLDYKELFNPSLSATVEDNEIQRLRTEIANNIKIIHDNAKRIDNKFTQEKFAEKLGYSSTKHLTRIFRGEHDLRLTTIIDVANALKIQPSILFKTLRSDNKMDLTTFIEQMELIKAKGYIRTLRRGDTGVGHTLEQELGLTENNISLPDLSVGELKAARRNTTSMLTLFTKEPLSNYGRKRDRYLLNEFAYDSEKEDRLKELYTTIDANNYNSQGFKLELGNGMIKLVHREVPLDIYWTEELLREVFEEKFPALVYVIADSKGVDSDESFHYTEAQLLTGFDFNGFMKAVEKCLIKVDLRMHMKNSGVPRNHGTAFRIIRSAISSCFINKKRLV